MSWDLSTAAYSNKSFSVASQETAPNGVAFGDSGTKMYVLGANETVYQYSLSTAWDISTASYASKSFSVAGMDYTPRGVFFRDDGTSMYVTETGPIGIALLQQFDLSTPWDVTTAVFASKTLDVFSTNTLYGGITFKTDGTQVYVTGGAAAAQTVQHSLGTAWDLSTAGAGTARDLGEDPTAFAGGIALSSDGTKMFLLTDGVVDGVLQYTLTTPWDHQTEVYDNLSFSVAAQESAPRGLAFSDDGTKFYVVGTTNDTVYQYSVAGVGRGLVVGSVTLN